MFYSIFPGQNNKPSTWKKNELLGMKNEKISGTLIYQNELGEK